MFRCLLVDLDGVVRHWDPQIVADVEQRHGLPAGSIGAAAFGDQSVLREVVTGRITDQEWRANVAARLRPLAGPAASAAVAEWSAPVGAVDEDVLFILRQARGVGWRIGLLTNATTRLAEDLTQLRLHDEFDVVVNSADLGVAKPDPAAFAQACALFGVDPQACVFVDDTEANVQGATEVGLKAHVFQGTEWLADLLGVVADPG